MIREKIIASAGSRSALEVLFDDSSSSPVPDLVRGYFASPDDQFVPVSRASAEHLYNSQTGVNPAGLLTVVAFSVSNSRGLAIAKLEREEGARIEPQHINGQQTFGLEVLRDLLLTQGTRLFKLGIFVNTGSGPDEIEAFACDEQRPYGIRNELAYFFLRTFLGCELAETAEITTARFFEASQEYFNQEVDDAALRVTYTNHLLSELTNEVTTVNPRLFSERNLRTEHRQEYLQHLESKRVIAGQFPKNVESVARHLARLQVDFEHGISIVGNRDQLDQHMSLSTLDSGETQAVITDR
ncbi:MAG: nucleoid-associated protein, partial [Dehalococcoidia bacterium]